MSLLNHLSAFDLALRPALFSVGHWCLSPSDTDEGSIPVGFVLVDVANALAAESL